ncbi:RbsD/FucU family protein [Pseudoprimorskyibacter insulae]|uniref:L-fucose mutarotase n=1 Tax=Pseudoprimorskyibacter insulae TaxID=1695997 RepID=A0A2R8B045_9RHOB|nr:RbsD/FucU domain-containing protein [Pseudoprimorskyibacter insulae]SPF81504.1 L-fucose mutarotase [Pseudoprimorskyibacter insulae]
MLKGIDQRLTAEILHMLMSMGHGDSVLLCDVNHPAAEIARHTVAGKVLHMAGSDLPAAIGALLSLMPLDTFIPEPVQRMKVVGDPEAQLPLFSEIQSVVNEIEGRDVGMGALDRFEFYAAARNCFGVIRTSDSGPYGCFILTKGVINLPPVISVNL